MQQSKTSFPRRASALLAAATLALLAAPAAQAQPRGPHHHGPVVRCESYDGRYTECRVPFRGPVVLVEQLSSSSCIPGRTFGAKRGRIWVSGGCRGDFAPRR